MVSLSAQGIIFPALDPMQPLGAMIFKSTELEPTTLCL